MTLYRIAVKNLKSHARRYLSFFLCNTFAIAILFTYSSLFFHPKVSKSLNYSTKDMMMACAVAIILFIFAFLNYAYWTFMKARNSEFGLFTVLGMGPADMKKLILIENTAIISFSLAAGLFTGLVFARLFFMAAMKLLGQNSIRYSVGANEFAVSILVYLVIFLVMNTLGNRLVQKIEPVELLKYGRQNEKGRFRHPLFMLAGLAAIVFAYLMKYLSMKDIIRIEEVSTKFVLILFTGLYFLIAPLSNVLIRKIKKRRAVYVRHLLAVTELNHKLNRNITALYIMCILSALIMFFLGDSYTKYLLGYASVHYYHEGNGFRAEVVTRQLPQEASMLIFISIFLAILFFVSAGCIIYFKLFSELDDEQKRFYQLYRIGIGTAEMKRIVSMEMLLLFFFPLITGILIVYPYILIDNLLNEQVGQVLKNFTFTALLYLLFQVILYWIVRKRYVLRITASMTGENPSV